MIDVISNVAIHVQLRKLSTIYQHDLGAARNINDYTTHDYRMVVGGAFCQLVCAQATLGCTAGIH
jgi:hypothetical protein